MERRYDQAQIERDSVISNMQKEVDEILIALESVKERLSKYVLQVSLHEKSMLKLKEDHKKERDTLRAKMEELKDKSASTTQHFNTDIQTLEDKENELIVSQLALQTNVHNQLENMFKEKTEITKEINECKPKIVSLEERIHEEKKQLLMSKDCQDKSNGFDEEEKKLQTDFEIQLNLLNAKKGKIDTSHRNEVDKIEEAWRDIYEHEADIQKQEKECGTSDNTKIKQRRVHIEEAKELLKEEQNSINETYQNSISDINKEIEDLSASKQKILDDINSRQQQLLCSLSTDLAEQEKDLVAKRQYLINKEQSLIDCETEIENLEGMLSLSTQSSNVQQQGLEREKSAKMEAQNLNEEKVNTQIKEFEQKIVDIDQHYEELFKKMENDIQSSKTDLKTGGDLNEIILKELSKLEGLYNKKHSDLLMLKQQAEEKQDNEFESLELEIMKLEEMQNQARVEQEVQRRLKNVRQNRFYRRSNYESLSSLVTEANADIPSNASSTISLASNIGVNIASFCLKNVGSDSYYEYEIQMVIGKDNWTIFRRYRKFREMHKELQRKIPEMRKTSFPPKKIFMKSEKILEQRRKQLEIYLQNVLEIFIKTPWCPLHPSQNKNLNMKLLCDFEPFFKRGLFERSTSSCSS